MGKKILTEQDRVNKRLKEEHDAKQKALRNKVKSLVFNRLTAVILLCMCIFGVAVIAKDYKISTLKFLSGIIDWNSLSVSTDDLDTSGVERIEGTIDFDAYYKYRKAEEQESIELAKPVITSEMYNNMMDGIESKYYFDSVQADYYDMCNEVNSLVKQSEYIIALYTAYQRDVGLDEYDTDECLGLEEGDTSCDLKDIIETFTTGELQEYLLDAHHKWEVMTNYRKSKVNITDGYTDLLYQDTIVTDLSTLSKLDGELYIIGKKLYDSGEDKIWSEIQKGAVKKIEFNEKTPETALKQLTLYNDINFYDEDFAKITSNTITALFAGNTVVDNATYLGSDLTQDEILEQIQNKEVATSSDALETVEGLGSYVPLTFSLTGRDENDIYYIFYKIDDIEHNMSKVETYESMKNDLEDRAKAIEAQKDISAIITAEVENLDITDAEDIKEYFPEFVMTDDEIEAQADELAENSDESNTEE